MEKEILVNLLINHYKLDMLSEHIKVLNESDVFYEDIKLNDSSILRSVFHIVGFPFHGEVISEEYQKLFSYLEEHYFDNIFSCEHANYSDLKQKTQSYIRWLYESKELFDAGKLELWEDI